MKKLARLIPLMAFAPLLALAQASAAGNFQGFKLFIQNTADFINNVLVPFIFAIALIVFLWGVFQTFILGGQDEEKQSKGKQLMMYAIVGFVVMVSIWGLVNWVASSFGFAGEPLQNVPSIPSGRTTAP